MLLVFPKIVAVLIQLSNFKFLLFSEMYTLNHTNYDFDIVLIIQYTITCILCSQVFGKLKSCGVYKINYHISPISCY